MSCSVCGRRAAAGSCAEGYIQYLSGQYPCAFNPDPTATVRDPIALPALVNKVLTTAVPVATSDGLEDLL